MKIQKIQGKIIERTGDPKGHKYKILGNDGVTYFSHVGDLEANETLVYESEHREDLEVDDIVEFTPLEPQPRAVKVKKV
jgi:hypothetical protein